MENENTAPQAENALNMYIEIVSPMGSDIFAIGKIGSGTVKLGDQVSIVNQNATFCKHFTVAFITHFDEGFINASMTKPKKILKDTLKNAMSENAVSQESAHENSEVGVLLKGWFGKPVKDDLFLVNRTEYETENPVETTEQKPKAKTKVKNLLGELAIYGIVFALVFAFVSNIINIIRGGFFGVDIEPGFFSEAAGDVGGVESLVVGLLFGAASDTATLVGGVIGIIVGIIFFIRTKGD
ncbi:MAG: hypothetical protein FWG68_08950 [Defluviitaleaceae bacterium]|nr:hypothetical protein [Defluviitaleaceae bacterium]